MTLPIVDFCGLKVARLIMGANPLAGFSHQNPQRDAEMLAYYTIDRIIETWERARAAGINTIVTNNETQHVHEALQRYLPGSGLQWIAQVRGLPTMEEGIDEAVRIGCKAIYIHGALVDDAYSRQDSDTIGSWCDYARSAGVAAGVAGHAPEAHLWVNSLNVADFHAVCFFNCGSLHAGRGEKFDLKNMFAAVEAVRRIPKPCIAYKIMGAGRIDARMAFEYAFDSIKPTDVVNVGMHRGDRDDMVEANVAMVGEILAGKG